MGILQGIFNYAVFGIFALAATVGLVGTIKASIESDRFLFFMMFIVTGLLAGSSIVYLF